MFEGNTSKIQKFLVAVKLNQPADLRTLMRGFWTRFFVEDKDIFDIADIREVCAKLNISNVEKLIQQSEEQSVGDEYRKYTNEAVDSDAFGLPWILLQNEGQKPKKFFGTDRLPILFNELGVKFDGPLNVSKL
ncbi:Glutathione S-transferase kappa [Aphelenchoides besseyi]|nr:Glutathione S-transferase kappa [Aphelenchoides besseyi]